jgi:peptidoglycan/LPS O-acetylase OafA/YrhL
VGSFRLLLAYIVLAAHMGWDPFGLMPGVSAVVGFFVLSGFVMTALIEKHYASVQSLAPFYADRIARIFPQLLLYLGLTVLFVRLKVIFMGTESCTTFELFLNAAGFPLGFYMYWMPNCLIIQPTWSIGLELCFYATIPFILWFNLRTAAFVTSFAFFVIAFFGIVNPDIFGYRLLPGTLFMFLIGSYIYIGGVQAKVVATSISAFAFIGLALTIAEPALNMGLNRSVLLGLIVAIPAVWLLRAFRGGRWDALAGNLSYGIFLAHYPIAAMLPTINSLAGRIFFVAMLSTIAAKCSFALVERPVLKWRRILRGQSSRDIVTHHRPVAEISIR